MRFHENGPDIPDDLLNRRANGNVVFFCGAGISVDAGQPTFWRLTLQALDRLGVGKDSNIGRALRKARRANQPTMAPPLDQVFGWLQNEYSPERVERITADILRRVPIIRSAHHDAILRLSTDQNGNPLVVTTNFDLLFEKVASKLRRWLSPDLPDFKLNPSPSGIVYLHGRLPEHQVFLPEQRALVLGSGDFGRAYLADGWATRFLTQLLDNRTVVLLGYSAGDPPVRYLLEGLNATAPNEERVIYALDRGDPDEVRARWQSLGVKGIAYTDFTDLWTSLEAWAERAATPESWREGFMALARQEPRTLRPHERGQVSYFARTVEGAKEFAKAAQMRPPAEWLCVFDQAIRLGPSRHKYLSAEEYEIIDPLVLFGIDGDVRPLGPNGVKRNDARLDFLSANLMDDSRIQSRLAGNAGHHAGLPVRLRYLSGWIADVAEQPAALWWAASQSVLHPELIQDLRRRLGRPETIAEDMRVLWSFALLVLERPVELDDLSHRWFRWRGRVATDGWTAAALDEFRSLVTPQFHVRATSLQQYLDAVESSILAVTDPSELVRFGAKGSGRETPNIPDEQLLVAFRIIREGLERISLTLAGKGIRTDLERLPAIDPDDRPGERFISEDSLGADVLWAVELYRRLAEIHPDEARIELKTWLGADVPMLIKLRVFAWTIPGLASTEEVFAGLAGLMERAFWDHELSRELLHLFRARWSEFTAEQREVFERRIIAGEDGKGADGGIREVSSIGATLGWLQANGCSLGAEAEEALVKIRARADWNARLEETADHDRDGRGGGVVVNTDPGDLPTMSMAEIDRFFATLPSRQFGVLREDLPFVGFVEKAPRRALAWLCYRWRKGEVDPNAWGQLVMHWQVTKERRLTVACARRLVSLPDEAFLHLRLYIANWATVALTPIKATDVTLYWRLWDAILDRIEELGELATRSIREDRPNPLDEGAALRSRKGREFARSGVVGVLARDLLDKMVRVGPAKIHPIDGDTARRLERCLATAGEGGDHATLEIALQLPLLFARHQRWTSKVMLPRFDLDHSNAEVAWTGLFLGARLPQPGLFKRLKPSFIKLFASRGSWIEQGEFEKIAAKLTVLAGKHGLTNSNYPSPAETHFVFRHLTDVGRQAALEQVRSIVTSKPTWRQFGMRFFESMWPQELRYQTRGTTNQLLDLAKKVPDAYDEIIDTVVDWLQPDALTSLHDFTYGPHSEEGAGLSLAERQPAAVLRILERVLSDSSSGVPYDLRRVLDQIVSAAPSLASSQAWRKLNRFAS